jgi:CARDB
LAFLDEDDPFSPVGTEPDDLRPGPPNRQRQYLVRRLAAVAVGILILILLVLGIRGCLNARKERAFENYVRDLGVLTADSQQLSQGFFGRLEDPGNLTELNFEAEVKADRGAAEGLLTRARGLDAPGELSAAQADLVLAFELRRDGLAAISEEVGTALGDEGREEAIAAIAEDMQFFVAGDVLYRRAEAQINQVLAEEGIDGTAPESEFLPGIDWLDDTTIAESLNQISGEEVTGGVHGLGLLAVVAQPGAVELSEGTPAAVSGEGTPELEVQVQNQGDSEETEIPVTVEVAGGEETIEAEGTIDRIAPQETTTVTIPLEPEPPQGEQVSVDVSVTPVPGEEVADNNEATYEVTFE